MVTEAPIAPDVPPAAVAAKAPVPDAQSVTYATRVLIVACAVCLILIVGTLCVVAIRDGNNQVSISVTDTLSHIAYFAIFGIIGALIGHPIAQRVLQRGEHQTRRQVVMFSCRKRPVFIVAIWIHLDLIDLQLLQHGDDFILIGRNLDAAALDQGLEP